MTPPFRAASMVYLRDLVWELVARDMKVRYRRSVLGVLWSLASPVFSVPDENAHAVKAIAQLRGQVIGYTVPG